MMKFNSDDSVPGLLVSVRSALEALEALAGGADVIDVKEPTRGSLGAADVATISEVVRAVNNRAIVTAALGELTEFASRYASNDLCGMPSPRSGVGMFSGATCSSAATEEHATLVPTGVSLFKIGLAACGRNTHWASLWRDAIASVLDDGLASVGRPVAVVYADWQAANSPKPIEVLNAAVQFGCPALLVDTWDKSSGSLFDYWPAAELSCFVEEVRSRGVRIVLAGSLTVAVIVEAARLGPDLIAVRTAACEGGRNGAVSRQRVQKLKQLLTALKPASSPSGAKEFP